MPEIEVKILEIDKDKLISILEEKWAMRIFEWKIENDFFRNSKKNKIRLRKMGNKNYMTFKHKIEHDTVMNNMEHELEFNDFETMINILEWIGFERYGKSTKYRISYKLWEIEFDFDKYENIPDFVEVEAKNIEDLKKWVELLGYKMSETSKMTERLLKEFYNIN